MTLSEKMFLPAIAHLVGLFLNPPYREMNFLSEEKRDNVLATLMGMMHETLLDQLPVLIELKQFISRLTLSGNTADKKPNLLLEDLPQIQENLIKEVERDGGFYKIAQDQDSVFLNTNKEQICALASRLSTAYSTELLCELEQSMSEVQIDGDSKAKDVGAGGDGGKEQVTVNKCSTCQAEAQKKCANCKQIYYCSRECQLKDWPQHKTACLK